MPPTPDATEPANVAVSPPQARKAGPPAVPRGVWQVATVVVVGAFMTQLDTALVNVGLATLATDLRASLRTTQWVVSGYLLALVIGLPLCGWGSRRLGAGRLWLWALGAFTAASALCAVAPDMGSLIGFRVLQGLAGGLLLPAGQTVIAQVAGRDLMGRVMSAAGAALVLGPAAGPTVGGLLIAHASWRWLFLVNIPVGALGLWLGARLIPRGEPVAGSRFDVAGFALVGLALPAVTYAVSLPGQSRELTFASFYGPLGLGCVALAVFAWRGPRTAQPLLDVRLFANRVFAAASGSSLLAGAIQFGALVIWALYFQMVRGYGVVGTGLAMVGFALGAAVLPVSGRLTDRFGGGPVSLAGAAVTTAAFVPAALLPASTPLLVLEVCLLALGVGNALSVVPSSTAAYVSVGPADMPNAVTLVNIFLRLGGAVGSSLLVAVLSGRLGDGAPAVTGFHAAFWWLVALSAASVATALGVTAASGQPAARGGQPPTRR